jgi:hypothetical protein
MQPSEKEKENNDVDFFHAQFYTVAYEHIFNIISKVAY